jgi:hypothetical protein
VHSFRALQTRAVGFPRDRLIDDVIRVTLIRTDMSFKIVKDSYHLKM